ncbi:MAG: outer membrane beta-barrel domain-containing protein [Deltaproteobacteria bacterium]|nr:MAG: outer membrane beta-barrel domain-containing protein [Deltaproteobacteria bacterium]
MSLAAILLPIGSFVAVGSYAGEAVAQSRSFDEGPVVRRVLLFRSDRFEVTPMLGSSLNDVYERSFFVGGIAQYHLTNTFSIGVNAFYSPLATKTSLYSNFESASPDRFSRMSTARTFLTTDLHVGMVPFSGKLNLAGRNVLYYDVHLFAGFGAAMRASDAEDLSGVRAGPAFGAGARLFLRDDLALRLVVRDHVHLSADAETQRRTGAALAVDEQSRHHYFLGLGVSFFFPDSIRISR